MHMFIEREVDVYKYPATYAMENELDDGEEFTLMSVNILEQHTYKMTNGIPLLISKAKLIEPDSESEAQNRIPCPECNPTGVFKYSDERCESCHGNAFIKV